MERKCENCRFVSKGELNKDLERALHCRRFPPLALSVPTQQGLAIATVFPEVSADHWCGEYEPTLEPHSDAH